MADNTQKILQEVVLKLTEEIQNQGKITDHVKKIDKTVTTAEKSMFALGKTIRVVGQFMGATAKAFGLAAAVIATLSSQSKKYLDGLIKIGGGAKYIDTLKKSYDELVISNNKVVMSMQDLVEISGKFASQGISQMILAQSQDVTRFLGDMTTRLEEAFGKNEAAEQVLAITQAFGDNKVALQSFAEAWNKAGGNINEQIKSISDNMFNMGDPVLAARIQSALEIIQNKSDDLTSAARGMHELTDSISSLGENTLSLLLTLENKHLGWIGKITNAFKSMAKDFNEEVTRITQPSKGGAQGSAAGDSINPAVERAKELKKHLIDISLRSEDWNKQLSTASTIMSTIADTIETTGTGIEFMGRNVQEYLNEAWNNSIMLAEKAKNAFSSEDLAKAQEAVAEEQKKYYDTLSKFQSGQITDEKEVQAAATSVNKALEYRNRILDTQKQSYNLIKDAIEGRLAPLKAEMTIVSATKELDQSRLAISQALYGTAGLAVQAQLRVVDSIQKEKETLLAMRDELQAAIKEAQGEDLLFARKKLLEVEKEITDKTAEQLNMVKSLRDGYLDAISAQALGAGRFEKIIITREQNLSKALESRMAKENYLLGQVGQSASTYDVAPYRFSASGMGTMESLGTMQTLTPQEVASMNQQRLSNVSDEETRRIMKYSQDLVMQTSQNIGNVNETMNNYIKGKTSSMGLLGLQGAEGTPSLTGGLVNKNSRGSGSSTTFTPTSGNSFEKNMQSVVKVLMDMARALDKAGNEGPGTYRSKASSFSHSLSGL